MSLQIAHTLLGWPDPEQILNPSGVGPAVLAKLAKQKLQSAIRRIRGCHRARVGILSSDSYAKSTQAPLAVVVDFGRVVADDALKEAHRLAWNFARSPLLITIDPVAVRSWSCCEPPESGSGLFGDAEIPDARLDLAVSGSASACAAHALSWLSLLSGDFFREPNRVKYFDRDHAADRLLLDNLKEVRRRLHAGDARTGRTPLDYGTIHALLARLMFLQFLADRRDAEGNAALNPEFFEQRRRDGTLGHAYESIADLLGSKGDTYQLFGWLNTKFNGDLFPTPKEQRAEERVVTAKHLKYLAQFISGDVQVREGQRFLWRQYSFDVIPLEFISSIYEEFIRNGDSKPGVGVVYTPPHLVDFILDGALPWDGEPWDLTVLDPACGSGIFLVKAYQRLVHRWKVAHPRLRPSAGTLRRILERCIFGIDTEEDAVRVASFSLYLAMCDEIDPKRYWTSVRFPRLRGRTINRHDFFEDGPTLVHRGESRKFDLVVGNPPWGQEEKVPDAASRWIEREGQRWPENDRRSWETSYVSIGPLFLPRAAEVIKPDGCVTLMQSSAVLLNDVGTARQFRSRLFSEFSIEEIANLSPLRYILFSNTSRATAPPCVISFRHAASGSAADSFAYICPKPVRTVEDQYRLTVGPYDVHTVQAKEVVASRNVLTTLLWGGRRDVALLDKLSHLPTLATMKDKGKIITRQGVVRGDRKKVQAEIVDRHFLEAPNFPDSAFLRLDSASLPKNKDPFTDSRASTNFQAFELPQLLIKLSWIRSNGRFRAVRVSAGEGRGVICSQSYVTVHADAAEASMLDSACLVYNSSFALYWMYLTDHWLASFIAKPTVTDLLRLPLPPVNSGGMDAIEPFDFAALDRLVKTSLGLHDNEWALIEDFFTYTLPDFKRLPDAPGGLPTARDGEPDLTRFCDHLLRVLEAAFGRDCGFSATVFQETEQQPLAVRLVAIHLKPFTDERVRTERIDSEVLYQRLRELEEVLRTEMPPGDGIGYQRVVRVYGDFGTGRSKVPTLYLIKPDQKRFWTASAAMKDADMAFNEIMLWDGDERPRKRVAHES